MNGQENTPGNSQPSCITSSLLCANGCGFYGSPTTKNLCSKCYRDFLKIEKQQQEQQMKQQQAEAVIRAAVANQSPTPPCEPQDAEMAPAALSEYTVDQTSNMDANFSKQQHPDDPSLSSPASVAPEIPASDEAAIPSESLVSTNVAASSATSSAAVESDANPVQKNTGRCFQCQKKVGLLGFLCRCGYNFCGSHRHADQHDCQFDYRELARQQLSKANQKVVADKLNRI